MWRRERCRPTRSSLSVTILARSASKRHSARPVTDTAGDGGGVGASVLVVNDVAGQSYCQRST